MDHADRFARDAYLTLRDLVKTFGKAQPKDRAVTLVEIIAVAGSFMDVLSSVEKGVQKRNHTRLRGGMSLGGGMAMDSDELEAVAGMGNGPMPGDLASRLVEEAGQFMTRYFTVQEEDRAFSRRLRLLATSADLRQAGDEAGALRLIAEAQALIDPSPTLLLPPAQEPPCPAPSSAPPSEATSG